MARNQIILSGCNINLTINFEINKHVEVYEIGTGVNSFDSSQFTR
jgi:hypothetical protein